MSLSNEEIASSISGHTYEVANVYLSDTVTWTLVGAEPLSGKEAVLQAFEASAVELADVTTEFRKFRALIAGDSVVVDTLADYTDPDGNRSTVASCDIYDFENGLVVAIVSYNIEIAS